MEANASPENGRFPMANDLSVGLLTVVGALAGLASLLVLLSALDPTSERRGRK